ncbi:MAG: hypothetical protein ACI4SF_03125 [Oscillospiraceae bacterium]
MVNEQVTTIELASGTPQAVKFSESYPYYWVINMSGSEVYAAIDSTPEADSDGTYTIASGEKLRISGSFSNSLTLLGEGKVQVIAASIATPPFVVAKKGGDEIELLKFIDVVSECVSGSSYNSGSVFILWNRSDGQKEWDVLRFNANPLTVKIGNYALSRESGFNANKFTLYGGMAVTAAIYDNDGFIYPNRYKGAVVSNWGFTAETDMSIDKMISTKTDITVSPALNDIWTTDEKGFKIELPLRFIFKDCWTLANADDVTGIFALWWNNSYQFLFMVNNRFPVLDYANDRILYGSGETFKLIGNFGTYLNGESYTQETITLPAASETEYVSGFKSKLDLSKVYFNSEDILDENGNVILPKNCNIEDFI